MDAQQIIHDLMHADSLPKKAMNAASANPAAVTPAFLELFEDFINGREISDETVNGLFLSSTCWRSSRNQGRSRPS